MKIPTSEKEQLRRDIFESICRDHSVSIEDLRSRKQSKRMLSARTDTIDRLKIAGFSDGQICRMFGRSEKFVRYHRNRQRELARHRGRALPHWTRGLSADVRSNLLKIAAAENVSAHVLMLEWVSERVRYEAETSAPTCSASMSPELMVTA